MAETLGRVAPRTRAIPIGMEDIRPILRTLLALVALRLMGLALALIEEEFRGGLVHGFLAEGVKTRHK